MSASPSDASAGRTDLLVEGAARPLGAYPHLVRVGSTVYVSGTSSRRPDGSIAGAERGPDGMVHRDVRLQTAGVLDRIDALLGSIGGGLRDLVQVTTFLVSMDDFAAYNEVYGTYFPDGGPARTTVAVRELPHPDLLIEIQGVAVLGVREPLTQPTEGNDR